MTAFLWCVVVYVALHVIAFGINVKRGRHGVIKLGLVALGLWAGWLLVA